MAKVYFYNEDCFQNMERMASKGFKVDIVLTSPPYATSRAIPKSKEAQERAVNNHECRYDVHIEMDEETYLGWSVNLFNHFDDILAKDGVILYNISYGTEHPNTLWLTMADIIRNTNFMIADCIIWKKRSALPNNVSKNKLTRITEFVFVLCRKDEYKTFRMNKPIKSTNERTGQNFYENVFNFIEAPNNDGTCKLNKATYSSELCLQLLQMYADEHCIVYDPFMGTGTTGIACEKFCKDDSMMCIGSELSEAQVQFSKERLARFREENE